MRDLIFVARFRRQCTTRTSPRTSASVVEVGALGVPPTRGAELTESGVREYNVDSSARSLDGLVETIEVREAVDVPLDPGDVVTDIPHRLIEFFLTAARDKYVCALHVSQRSIPFECSEAIRNIAVRSAGRGHADDCSPICVAPVPGTIAIACPA
jgi:hypothetical protein